MLHTASPCKCVIRGSYPTSLRSLALFALFLSVLDQGVGSEKGCGQQSRSSLLLCVPGIFAAKHLCLLVCSALCLNENTDGLRTDTKQAAACYCYTAVTRCVMIGTANGSIMRINESRVENL